MAKDHLVSLRLPDDLLAALARAARQDGVSAADLLRQVLRQALVRRDRPRIPGDVGVRQAVRDATGWTDLQSRLRALGFMLRPSGDAVILHRWPLDHPLIRAEAAGIDPVALTLRFGAAFPGFTGREPAIAPADHQAGLPRSMFNAARRRAA